MGKSPLWTGGRCQQFVYGRLIVDMCSRYGSVNLKLKQTMGLLESIG
jgi:hypothetical protein